MSILKDLADKEIKANVERETAATKSHHTFDADDICPECGEKMEKTSVAGLPATVCLNCRICLPGLE